MPLKSKLCQSGRAINMMFCDITWGITIRCNNACRFLCRANGLVSQVMVATSGDVSFECTKTDSSNTMLDKLLDRLRTGI